MELLSVYIEDELSAKVLVDNDSEYFKFAVQMYKQDELINTQRFTTAGVAEDYADDWVKGIVK